MRFVKCYFEIIFLGDYNFNARTYDFLVGEIKESLIYRARALGVGLGISFGLGLKLQGKE